MAGRAGRCEPASDNGLGDRGRAVLANGRDQEREADLRGIELLDRADVDPGPMIDFYERLHAMHPDGFQIPEFLSTHPGGEERVSSLNRRLAELGRHEYRAFSCDWDEVRERVARGR